MTRQEYTREYNHFVKRILKKYEKSGIDLDADEKITEPVLTCKWLLEYGAIHRYFDTTNRLLALFMYGVEYGIKVGIKTEKKAAAATNDNRHKENTSATK